MVLLLALHFTQGDTSVLSAKTKGVGNGHFGLEVASHVGRIVQVAFGVRLQQINSRSHLSVLNSEGRNDKFGRASSAQHVSHHRLCGADDGLVCLSISQHLLDGTGFRFIVQRGTRAVGVDIEGLVIKSCTL